MLASFYGTSGAAARAAHSKLTPEVRAALQEKYGDLTRVLELSSQEKPVIALRVVRRRTPPAPLRLLTSEDQAALEQKYGSLVHQIGSRPAGMAAKASLPLRKTEHPNVVPPPGAGLPAPPAAAASTPAPAARPLNELDPTTSASGALPATVAAPPINPTALQLPDAPTEQRTKPTGPVSNLPAASTAAYANDFDISELDKRYDRSSSWALGQGGMGAVSTITKRATGELFALKVRLPGPKLAP